MAYEKGKPEPGIKAKLLDDRIRGNNDFIQPAINNEHNFVDADAGNQTGDHTQGSARCFSQATAPATRIDGSTFESTDLGSLWVDTDDNAIYVLTAITPTWTPVSDEVIATLLAANRVFAGTLGVTGVLSMAEIPVFTKGVTAGDTALQSRNFADDGNIDLIKATTLDEVMLFHSAAKPARLQSDDPPIENEDIANKLYVDNRRAYIKLIGATASGVQSGTFTSGAWTKRTVTEETDTGNNASVSSSVVTLQAGTYECLVRCAAHDVDRHQARLENTDDTISILGTSEFCAASDSTNTASVIAGRFTIASAKDFEIQHRCTTTKASDGYGVDSSFGVNNIFVIAEFWKI